MAWRHNRWIRRWFATILVWAIPVAIVALREIREEMAYNIVDRDRALTAWVFTDSQRAAGAPARCRGTPDEARARGCPADVLMANAARHQAAIDEYLLRRTTLASYLWHAFVGFWVVPATFLFSVGLVVAGIRRALRRSPVSNRTTLPY